MISKNRKIAGCLLEKTTDEIYTTISGDSVVCAKHCAKCGFFATEAKRREKLIKKNHFAVVDGKKTLLV